MAKKKKPQRQTVKFDAVAAEIRNLYKASKGRLHPAYVVEAARDPDSPLHSQFCWDDTKAAHEYRVHQARQLVARVKIIIPSTDGTETVLRVRAYHQLRSDRNGYRHTRDIAGSAELRESLLAQLASDLERIRERYMVLESVVQAKPVFKVISEFIREAS